MLLIHEKVEFKGDPALVWERLSDIERIPEFWHGTRSLEILDKGGEAGGGSSSGRRTLKAKAKFAFGGFGSVEITADATSKTLTSRYTSGPFTGVQVVKIVGNALEATWDVNFTGLYKLTSSWTGGHFRSGTVHALERLCAEEPPGEEKIAQA